MKQKILILAIAASLFYGCDKEKVENEILQEEKQTTATKKEKISGYVEKGPFVQGSNLTANELLNDLTQTGKTFTTNLKNSEGYFEIKNLNLKSPFLQLAVDGFYFDELKGELSKSKVTLYALANVKTKNSVNVNLLTHVQKDRIEKLMEQKKTFAESYKQSILEIGRSFYFTAEQLKNIDFANVKITGNNDASLMLLAVSCIFLEGKTEAELTSFLADYKNDLADNGKIDDAEIKNKIKLSSYNLHQFNANHKRPIDIITKNIVDYYKKKLKKDIRIGDFEKYIDHNKNGDLADYKNLKPNLSFQEIRITNGKNEITTNEILENIQGNGKKNYTIKTIELTGNNSSFAKIKGTKPNFSLDILKNGNFRAKIILEHPKYADIEKNLNIRVGLENLTFQKLTITNGKNSFSTQEILAQIQGQKDGYTIKSIAVSDNDKAEVVGTKPNFSIKIKKIGTFTATIILERTGFLDVEIENCEFSYVFDFTYGGSSSDHANSIIETADGHLVVAGSTASKGAGSWDIWILKLNKTNGNILWEKTYGDSNSDSASSIIETADGNLVVAGSTKSKGAGNGDIWVLKLNKNNGSIIWEKTYGGWEYEYSSSIIETADGNLVVVGNTSIFKIDNTGNKIWENKNVGGYNITETADGNLVVAGYRSIFKIDNTTGNKIWEKTYRGSRDDYGSPIIETADGNLVVAGYSKGAGKADIWVLKLNKNNGNIIWEKTYGGSKDDRANSIIETADGHLVVAGSTASKGAGYGDIWVLKLYANDGAIVGSR